MRAIAIPALVLLAACGPTITPRLAPTPTPGSSIRYAERRDSTDLLQARLVSLDRERLVFERYESRDGKWVRGSLPTDSVARLQVKVGRRGHPGTGALIGALAGIGLGVACESESSAWSGVGPGQCLAGYAILGTGLGAGIGALIRSDVFAPAPLPLGPRAPAPGPLVSRPGGIGVRIPFALGAPRR